MKKYILSFLLLSLLVVSGKAQSRQQTAKDSLQKASEALSFHPDSIPLRLNKAAWNIELEQWDYALNEYNYVLDKEPNNLTALYFRAYVNTRMRRYNFARLDYENLLKLRPGSFQAQLGLALLNQMDNRKREALDQISLVIDNFPDSASAWAARGGMEVENNQLESAAYDYGKALLLEPSNNDYRLARVDVYIKMRRFKDARADLDEMVRYGTPRAALREWYSKLR